MGYKRFFGVCYKRETKWATVLKENGFALDLCEMDLFVRSRQIDTDEHVILLSTWTIREVTSSHDILYS